MRVVNPSLEEFKELIAACGDGPVPFVLQLPNDHLTPVAVYANLRKSHQHAFFLESVETGSQVGRYSFMGAAPRWIYSYSAGRLRICDSSGKELSCEDCADPLQALRGRLSNYLASWPSDLELPPLVGGVVGYLGYDSVNYFEPVGEMLPDELGMPESQWLHTDVVICFDHLHSSIILAKCLLPEEIAASNPKDLHEKVIDELDAYAEAHLCTVDFQPLKVREALAMKPQLPEYSSNHTEQSFCELVERAKEHIRAGDVFQVVPSRRMSFELEASPLDVYRALRKINPSAYMFSLRLGEHELVGSSPETQLRCRKGAMMMRPLAGSRPRTGDSAIDRCAAAELLEDEKELAEHRMLVDLVRNDLGRVAKKDTVRITRLLEVEQYSHVMHLTSEVVAELDQSKHDVFDALRSTFPAGTLSGAPKVRAMQLINEMETVRRNVYGGLIGYIDYAGDCDSCIAIRTLMSKGKQGYVQAGCGLVADSDPLTEYRETAAKAAAVLLAVATAKAQ